MLVLGIDPGLARTGFAFVEERQGRYHYLQSGCITTAKTMPSSQRLLAIYEELETLIEQQQPQALALEKLFFSKNVRTALQVGEARGVVILAAAGRGLALFEYTPLQVKQAVAGYGRADKDQVEKMVCLTLDLKKPPSVDDEADALAVALCHLQSRRYQEAVDRGGS